MLFRVRLLKAIRARRSKKEKEAAPSVACIAMARNEGAYIADWILHHAYFGFGPLIIIFHECTDSTASITRKLSETHPVHTSTAEIAAQNYGDAKSTQVAGYLEGLDIARAHGASHAYLCDIDEFWTPTDFASPVQSVVNAFPTNSVVAFQWRNKWHDSTPFSPPFEAKNTLIPNGHVKTIFPLHLPLEWVDVHSVGIRDASYLLSDGSDQPYPGQAKQDIIETKRSIHDLRGFVLHRYWRSQIEYVAGLGRGLRQARPVAGGGRQSDGAEAVELRTNRWGYLPGGRATEFEVPEAALEKYGSWVGTQMRKAGILELRSFEQNRVRDISHEMVELIRTWAQDREKAKYLVDSLRGLASPEIIAARETAESTVEKQGLETDTGAL